MQQFTFAYNDYTFGCLNTDHIPPFQWNIYGSIRPKTPLTGTIAIPREGFPVGGNNFGFTSQSELTLDISAWVCHRPCNIDLHLHFAWFYIPETRIFGKQLHFACQQSVPAEVEQLQCFDTVGPFKPRNKGSVTFHPTVTALMLPPEHVKYLSGCCVPRRPPNLYYFDPRQGLCLLSSSTRWER